MIPAARERLVERFMAKTERLENGCLIWTAGKNREGGYGLFSINGVMLCAHRVAWTLFRGPIPEGMKVLHKCDTPACVEPDCLFLGTLSDNTQDMLSKGRNRPTVGERNRHAKLTAENIRDMRAMKGKATLDKIAGMFGVSAGHVGRILRGERWEVTS